MSYALSGRLIKLVAFPIHQTGSFSENTLHARIRRLDGIRKTGYQKKRQSEKTQYKHMTPRHNHMSVSGVAVHKDCTFDKTGAVCVGDLQGASKPLWERAAFRASLFISGCTSMCMRRTIAILGTGYVGLVQGVALHSLGNTVFLVDIDEAKIALLKKRHSPIHEPGLSEMLEAAGEQTLIATTNAREAIEESSIVFVCVQTPTEAEGQDTSALRRAARTIGEVLRGCEDFKIIVIKSTVLPGTTEGIVKETIEDASDKRAGEDFGLAMNPEFLREGSALHDFFHGDRIIIGSEDTRTEGELLDLYRLKANAAYTCTIKEAELVKYAANCFLAVKISYANEIGNLCKELGLDSHRVLSLVGKDTRIGEKFFDSGIGYGGSCFPKDVAALQRFACQIGVRTQIIDAAHLANAQQRVRFVDIVREHLQGFSGKRIAVLGLAFKKGTDDVRESPAHSVIRAFLDEDAEVVAHDPVAIETMRSELADVTYLEDAQEAVNRCDVVCILTDWEEYEKLSYGDRTVFLGRRLRIPGIGITW